MTVLLTLRVLPESATKVEDPAFRVQGLGFRVQRVVNGLRFRDERIGLSVSRAAKVTEKALRCYQGENDVYV